MYPLKLALRPWKLSPLSQWLASVTLGFLLFIFSLLFWFQDGLTPILARLSSDQVVTAYLDHSPETDSNKIVDTIKTQVGSSAQQVDYTDSQGFVTELEKSYPDLAREVSSLGQDLKQIAPQYVTIRGSLSPAQVENVKRIPGVESIDSSTERFRPILESLTATQWITRIFMAACLLGLFTLLLLMSRLNHSVHAEAFRLIEQLGGTRLQARLPQVVNQTMLGLLGGTLAATAWIFSQTILVQKIHAFSPFLQSMPPAPASSIFLLIGIGAAMGWLTGWMNSGAAEVRNG